MFFLCSFLPPHLAQYGTRGLRNWPDAARAASQKASATAQDAPKRAPEASQTGPETSNTAPSEAREGQLRTFSSQGALKIATSWKRRQIGKTHTPHLLGHLSPGRGCPKSASGPSRQRPGTLFLGPLPHGACSRRRGVWFSHTGYTPFLDLLLLVAHGLLRMLPYPMLLQTMLSAPTGSSSTQLALNHYAAACALPIH